MHTFSPIIEFGWITTPNALCGKEHFPFLNLTSLGISHEYNFLKKAFITPFFRDILNKKLNIIFSLFFLVHVQQKALILLTLLNN